MLFANLCKSIQNIIILASFDSQNLEIVERKGKQKKITKRTSQEQKELFK